MIHRVGNCFGITLWKGRARHSVRAEIWFCFSSVKPHTHPGQATEIVPLFGWSKFFRRQNLGDRIQEVNISPRTWFRSFTIPTGWEHWFCGVPLVFLNFTTGPSHANNLVYTQ